MENKKWLAAGAAVLVLLAVRMCARNAKDQPHRVLELGAMPVIVEDDLHYSEKTAKKIIAPLEQIRREADEKLKKYR
jgi:hypothetical protein